MDILKNEQMILSEELTNKQNELLKEQKEKLNQEKELLQLRPLKESLQKFSESQKQTIDEMTKSDFEKNKLRQKVRELESHLDLARSDVEELTGKYKQIV